MWFLSGGPPAPPLTLEGSWTLVDSARPGDWLALDDCWVLKSNLHIRIERVASDSDFDFDAPWILPLPGFAPHLCSYRYYYCSSPIAEIDAVQLREGLEIPVPRRTGAGFIIEPRAFRLALLLNEDIEELRRYAEAAKITLPAPSQLERCTPQATFGHRLSSAYLVLVSPLTRLWHLFRN